VFISERLLALRTARSSSRRSTAAKDPTKAINHFIDLGLVADVEGRKVRLSANAAVAVTLEEEQPGKLI
jgi:hypothetical protein